MKDEEYDFIIQNLWHEWETIHDGRNYVSFIRSPRWALEYHSCICPGQKMK